MDELIALGASLQQARQARDLDLEELEKLTRIRLKYLEAMESGAFGEIDNPLQLKGFLRSYAHAVELDPDTVLAHYEQVYRASQSKRGRRRKKDKKSKVVASSQNLDLSTPPLGYTTTQRRATQDMPQYGAESVKQQSALLRWFRLVFLSLLAIGLAIGVVVGGIYGINELTSSDANDAPEPLVTFATQSSDTSANQPFATPTSTGIILNPPQNDVDIAGANAFLISFTAEARLWVEVVVDGNQIFQGILAPDTGFQETVTESVFIKTSNAGSLLITINNEPFKLAEGRVEAEQTFTREGLIIPTQPPPDSPTPTAFDSPTATWTMVLALTATEDINALGASPSPTLFFTPVLTPGVPTLTLFPTPDTNSPTPLLPPPSVTPIFSPTATVTATLPVTSRPSLTPTFTATPTIPATATPFLPPRETSTPTPNK